MNTDASGKGSWLYGKTSNHVHSLRCILEDGDILDTANDTQVSSKWEARFHGLGRLLKSNSQIIDQGVSDHYRFFSGYNLKHAIRKETLNLNALMCGSEGTLGIISQATLSIEPLPQNRMLAVVAYSSFSQALSAAFHLRELKPLAIETIDSTIVTLAQSDPDSMTLLHYYFPKIKEQVLIINMRGTIMPSGKVKWFNSKKGYGFITEDGTEKDIFLHVSALESSKLRILKEEQHLEFDIKEEKDKLQAINLKKV